MIDPVRVLQRPFAACPALDEVHSAFITRADSISRTIQNSDVLSNAFHGYCKSLSDGVDGRRIRNLQFRKHRFDSVQRPTGRMVLFCRATVATAVHAAIHRKGQTDGDRAEAFLERLDEKSLLLLALLADASDECTGMLRILDSEEHDVAAITLELQALMDRIEHLFIHGHATSSGYTAYMLETLRRPLAFMTKSGPKTVGGANRISDSLCQDALKEMKCWVAVVAETIETEFPTFTLMASMSLFDLSKNARGANLEADDHAEMIDVLFFACFLPLSKWKSIIRKQIEECAVFILPPHSCFLAIFW